jgi:hypothetical protein
MKISRLTATAAAALALAAAAGTTSTAGMATAFAEAAQAAQAANPLGSQARLTNGDVVQAWTVSDLKPSSDAIPYAVHGTLWEATATDEAVQGTVIPIVSNLNARAANGQNYRVLFGVATPQGVNPATLAQGQKTTGKVYFDVTGEQPTSVVYNDGGQDLLTWSQTAQPATSARPVTSGPSSSSATAPLRTAPVTPVAPASNAPAATELAPGAPAVAPTGTAPATAPGAGAAATDIPGSTVGPLTPDGTPLSQDTVSPGESVGTPLPAAVQEAPAAPASPVPAAPAAPAPAAPAAPAPAAPAAPGAPAAPAAPAPVDGATTPTVPAGSDAPLTAGGIPTLVPAANPGVPTP